MWHFYFGIFRGCPVFPGLLPSLDSEVVRLGELYHVISSLYRTVDHRKEKYIPKKTVVSLEKNLHFRPGTQLSRSNLRCALWQQGGVHLLQQVIHAQELFA